MALDEIKDKKTINFKDHYENGLADWIQQEKAAIELIHVTGSLWFDKSVELVLFRKQLVDRSASEILNLHQYAKQVVKNPINVLDTLMLAKELNRLDLAPSRIDIGRLGTEWIQEKGKFLNVEDFVGKKLSDFIGKEKRVIIPKDVILYGFGRIGRLVMRELIAQAATNLLENAQLHTPTGTIIRLSLVSAGHRVCLQVNDNGPGVGKADRARIIERFKRLDASRNTPGHGLGLSLVNAVATLHRGRLFFKDSAPGLSATLDFPR